MDISTDNHGLVANSSSVARALSQNDDTIVLRSMIRRTRGVCLVSNGTLYERINGAHGEPIEKVSKGARPFPW